MGKKFEEDIDPEQLLEEAFIRNAQKEEQALFAQADSHAEGITEEELEKSYQKLVARLKREGVYEEDGESSRVISMEKKTKKKNTRRRYGIMKAAGFAFVGILCVFAASMTSEATRRYVVDGVRYLVGDDTRILVDNDENNETVNNSEYEARADIEKKLGVELPRFFYRPHDFEFKNYAIHKESGTAWIEYLYNEQIIMFYVDKGDENSISTIDSIHGENIESITIPNENFIVKIKKTKYSNMEMPNYSAQWERNGVIYQIAGKIELRELKKILKEIYF